MRTFAERRRRFLSRLSWDGVRAPSSPAPRREHPASSWLTVAAPISVEATRPGPLAILFALAVTFLALMVAGLDRRLFTLGFSRGASNAPVTPSTIFGSSLKAWIKADAGVFTDAAADTDGVSQCFTRADEAALRCGSAGLYVAAWVYIDASTVYGAVASKYNVDAQGGWYLVERAGTDAPAFTVRNAAGVEGKATWGATPSTGAWHFIEGWWDPADQLPRVSVDAGAAVVGGVPVTPPPDGTTDFKVCGGGAFAYRNGRQQMLVMLRGRLPSASERAALYNAGAGVSYADLPATLLAEAADDFHFWPLCEPTGSRIDQHGTAHLTAVGAPGVASGHVETDVAAAQITNAPIARWEDQGQVGNDITQSDITKQPLYIAGAYPYALYDGVDDTLGVTAVVPFPLSWWVTAKVDAGANLACSQNGGPLLFYQIAAGSLGWFSDGDSDAAAAATFGADAVYGITHAGPLANVEVFQDGVSLDSKTTTGSPISGTEFQLGGIYAGGIPLTGRIYGGVWASGTPSAAQIAALTIHMKSLAGIA